VPTRESKDRRSVSLPGPPFVLQNTVLRLRADPRVGRQDARLACASPPRAVVTEQITRAAKPGPAAALA